MRKPYRPSFFALLVPAFALVSGFAVVASAQAQGAPTAKATRWSDKASWPDKKVPVAGEKVEIASGKEVILDVSTPALGGLTINGKLSFADKSDLELNTEWVMVHGELEIGTEAKPFTRRDYDLYLVTRLDGFTVDDVIGLIDRGSTAVKNGRIVLKRRRAKGRKRLSA